MINVTNYIKFKSSVIIGLFLIFALQINIADAAKKKAKNKAQQHNPPVQTSLVVDVSNGKVLHSKNANVKIYPASLAKGMTLYLLFESINSGKISLNDYFHVSKAATKTLPSKLYLQEGEKIKVSDAVLALAVKSANDVAMVIAENLAGSEKKFINLMNKRAKQLGMNNTRFMNASGWHDPKQVSTANDIAKLYMALKRDFPKYYHFCSKTNFLFINKKINGHNRVMAA